MSSLDSDGRTIFPLQKWEPLSGGDFLIQIGFEDKNTLLLLNAYPSHHPSSKVVTTDVKTWAVVPKKSTSLDVLVYATAQESKDVISSVELAYYHQEPEQLYELRHTGEGMSGHIHQLLPMGDGSIIAVAYCGKEVLIEFSEKTKEGLPVWAPDSSIAKYAVGDNAILVTVDSDVRHRFRDAADAKTVWAYSILQKLDSGHLSELTGEVTTLDDRTISAVDIDQNNNAVIVAKKQGADWMIRRSGQLLYEGPALTWCSSPDSGILVAEGTPEKADIFEIHDTCANTGRRTHIYSGPCTEMKRRDKTLGMLYACSGGYNFHTISLERGSERTRERGSLGKSLLKTGE